MSFRFPTCNKEVEHTRTTIDSKVKDKQKIFVTDLIELHHPPIDHLHNLARYAANNYRMVVINPEVVKKKISVIPGPSQGLSRQ